MLDDRTASDADTTLRYYSRPKRTPLIADPRDITSVTLAILCIPSSAFIAIYGGRLQVIAPALLMTLIFVPSVTLCFYNLHLVRRAQLDDRHEILPVIGVSASALGIFIAAICFCAMLK